MHPNYLLQRMATSVDVIAILLKEDIKPTLLAIQVQLIGLPNSELELFKITKDTLPKHGLMEIKAYLYYYTGVMTNNGAESYHNTLRSCLKTNRPNKWKFMSSMYKVFSDYGSEVRRLNDAYKLSELP